MKPVPRSQKHPGTLRKGSISHTTFKIVTLITGQEVHFPERKEVLEPGDAGAKDQTRPGVEWYDPVIIQ